jgi:hypothetical protein
MTRERPTASCLRRSHRSHVRALYAVLLAGLLLVCGCAPYASTLGHGATAGALSALVTPSAKAAIDDVAAGAVGAARDEALGPATSAKAESLVTTVGAAVRGQLSGAEADLFGERLRVLLRALIDESLGPAMREQAIALRDELTGPALRKAVDDLIDETAPHLAAAVQTSLAPVRAGADAEADKYKTVAYAFGGSALVALVSLGVAIHMVRTHRRLIASLIERGHVDRTQK